jgi:hypothetical protein
MKIVKEFVPKKIKALSTSRNYFERHEHLTSTFNSGGQMLN